jgi:hypothetical protein
MKAIICHAILLLMITLSSCTKVINVDLNSVAPRIVIEGNIDNLPGADTVLISTTVNFSAGNTFPAVSGASVTITDDQGSREVLKEVLPGKYITATTNGTPGRKYTLTVSTDNKSYTAESTMPQPVNLDSLVIQESSGFGGGSSLQILPVFTDPLGLGNYYLFKEYRNNKKVENTYIQSDNLSDGLANTRALRTSGDDKIVRGDSVRVEMHCIDEATYKYFYSLNQNTNGQTAAPANPVTNWSNGALGYFSAHTMQSKSIYIP